MAESNCPLPTQDIKTNLANRQKAIDVAQYGPANPKEPNEEYWTEKAKTFGGSVEEAKTMRCGNCAGFNKTKKLMDCISKGIGTDAQEVEQAGDLGYCEIFDFKCASMRTCSAWIVGGPITDNANLELQKYTKPKLRERIKNRILRGTSGGKAGQWSARKAQLLVQAYEKAGGGYKGGRSKSQASLKKWGKEKWTTSDGKPSLRKGRDKRYLPKRVWDKLTPAQKAGANRTKAEGSKKGKQFVPNTPTVKKAFSYNGKTFELSDSATLLYDPSQTRDESGRWSGGGGGFKGKLIEKAQKGNPAIDIAKSSVKGAVDGITAIANGAKVAGQYGASKASQIKNWLASDNGQQFLRGVSRTIGIGSQGAIEAVKSAHGDRYKILVGSLLNPQVGAIVAGQSALRGFVKGAIAEYRKVEGGRQVSNIVRKGIGVRPMSANGNVVTLEKDPDMDDVADYLADAIAVAIREEIEGKKTFQITTFAYDPSQDRDESGKWTSGGGGGGEILVSPNIKENMNYEEAKKMTDSPEHARAVSMARDAIKKQDMDGKVESGVGDWEDGAENSIKIDVKGVKDFDQLKYTASKLGASLNQKAVVAFQKKKDGPDILHKISADRPMDEVRKILSDNGISFRTMVGDRAKTSVTILDQGSQLTANVAKFLGAINGKSEAVRGVGEFIGGDTRIAGKKAYKSIIDNYERSFPNRVRLGVQRGGGRNYYRSYQAIEFFDPNQQRDNSGRWTGGGAIAEGATPTPRWAQDNPAEASKQTGEATTLYHGTSADVLKDIRRDGLKPSKSGVWGGGKVYSTDSLDLAMEYGVLRSGSSPKIGGKQMIGIISVLADGFKSVADNIPTTKAQKMGKTGLAAVSKIFTKDGAVSPSAIKKMQIFEVDSIRKYVYENGPKPSPVATKELADGSKLIYVPIVIELPDDGSEGFQFDEAVAIESFVFQYNGEKIEFYSADQPRDEKGRWSGKGGGGGGGAKGKTKGKSSKGEKQSQASSSIDEIEKEIERLNAEPKTKATIEKMAKLQKEVAQAEGSENAPVTHWSIRDPKRYIQKKDIVETFENPTPEHKAWKDSVIESELNPKAKSDNPIAVILMGSPASGKTTTGRPFAEKILNGKETTKIDPDSVKGKSKGFEGWNAGAFHEESALISEKIVFPRAVMDNHNLLIDITGKNSNKVADMAKTLKSVGYKIGIVHVDVDDKVALTRASQRFNKPNGRYVPYNYIKGSAQQARNTWSKLTSEGIADIGYSLDGNADRSKGNAPVKATHGNLFD
jgi:adenylate kinase family enzyme